ncbi:unnamed protein product [Boreogadus saida]
MPWSTKDNLQSLGSWTSDLCTMGLTPGPTHSTIVFDLRLCTMGLTPGPTHSTIVLTGRVVFTSVGYKTVRALTNGLHFASANDD